MQLQVREVFCWCKLKGKEQIQFCGRTFCAESGHVNALSDMAAYILEACKEDGGAILSYFNLSAYNGIKCVIFQLISPLLLCFPSGMSYPFSLVFGILYLPLMTFVPYLPLIHFCFSVRFCSLESLTHVSPYVRLKKPHELWYARL